MSACIRCRATTPRSSPPPTAGSRRRPPSSSASRSATSRSLTCRRWCCPTRCCRRTCSASRSCRGCGATNTPMAAWCWSSRLRSQFPSPTGRRMDRFARFWHWGMHMNVVTPKIEALMFPTPKSALTPNTYAYESSPLVKPTGFREYDARWLLEKEINLMGVQALGMGLGTLIREMGVKPEIVTGHDFRSYSASVKLALVTGLLAAGCKVHDIGLAITTMAYFPQFELDVPCVAMVTASLNENGWTGVKMGANRPLTFGPDEMTRLKEIVLGAKFDLKGGGSYVFVENFPDCYIADLTKRPKIKRDRKS